MFLLWLKVDVGQTFLSVRLFDSPVDRQECLSYKAPCLHLSQKGTSIVKKQKERALSLPGKLPAPYKSRDFALRFGSGSPLPLIIA